MEQLNFGGAIEALKEGGKVQRAGWNGKNMYLILISGNAVAPAITEHYGKGWGEPDVPVQDAIYMYTAQGTLVPWLASQSDILAEDWSVVKCNQFT